MNWVENDQECHTDEDVEQNKHSAAALDRDEDRDEAHVIDIDPLKHSLYFFTSASSPRNRTKYLESGHSSKLFGA